jgi:hypothetical protein
MPLGVFMNAAHAVALTVNVKAPAPDGPIAVLCVKHALLGVELARRDGVDSLCSRNETV